MLEAESRELGRRYVLLFHETPGTYHQPFPSVPDGTWFVEELVADQKLGTWTGAELRDGRLPVAFIDGCSPLKVYRFTPSGKIAAKWVGRYRQPEVQSKR
jgi:hypothetical protein